MFNSTQPDQNAQTILIQQCLASYDYANAIALAENLLLYHNSEVNKGLLADCYLSQQDNQKAYILLKDSTSSLNLYKLAVACLRLGRLTEAEGVLSRGQEIPNGVHGIELLATVFRKQGKLEEAKFGYEEALKMAPMLLATKKELENLEKEVQAKVKPGGLFGGNYSAGNNTGSSGQFGAEKKAESSKESLRVLGGKNVIFKKMRQRKKLISTLTRKIVKFMQ